MMGLTMRLEELELVKIIGRESHNDVASKAGTSHVMTEYECDKIFTTYTTA